MLASLTDLDESDASENQPGRKPRNISDGPAPECDEQRALACPFLYQFIAESLQYVKGFAALAIG